MNKTYFNRHGNIFSKTSENPKKGTLKLSNNLTCLAYTNNVKI